MAALLNRSGNVFWLTVIFIPDIRMLAAVKVLLNVVYSLIMLTAELS